MTISIQRQVKRWADAAALANNHRRYALDLFHALRGHVRVRELARRSKVSAATISGLLQGEVVVSAETAARIADHLSDCMIFPSTPEPDA